MSTAAEIAAAEIEAAPLPPQWPIVVKLQHPVEFAGETIGELTFKRGTLGVIKGIKVSTEPTFDDLVTIAARLSGQPPKLIQMLDVDDAPEVVSIALDFFMKCLTGPRR